MSFLFITCILLVFIIKPIDSFGQQEIIRLSRGQTLYVPVYSQIYYGDRERPYWLAVTVSIRNTDQTYPITIIRADYYGTKGELLKRYIDEVKLGDVTNFGNSSLTIHFNKITPRWVLQDRYGIPVIKNLTPELLTVGHSSEVHGNANLRTQWRELSQKGIVHSLFGRS